MNRFSPLAVPSRRQFIQALGVSGVSAAAGAAGAVGSAHLRRLAAVRGNRALGERHRLEARQRDVAEPLSAGDHGPWRRVLRLRQRRLDRHLHGQQRRLGLLQPSRAAEERAAQEQPQRHLHRRHRQGGSCRRQRVRDGVRHRRLRQRRLPGHPGHRVRTLHAVPQQRQRHLHRRHREGRARRARMDHQRRLVRLRQRRQARSLSLQLRAVLAEERRLLRRQQARETLLLHPARVQTDAQPPVPQQRRRHLQGGQRGHATSRAPWARRSASWPPTSTTMA